MPTPAPRALLQLVACLPLALLSCAGDEGPSDRRLVLLISVDTLRADHVGAFGGASDLTPRIDALAAESIRFSQAYAPTPFTLPSISTLLTGRYPVENGVVRNDCVVPADVPSLAKTLAAAGFQTGAVVSNFVLRDVSGLGLDFDVYDDAFTRIEANRDVPERTAAETTDAALTLVDQLSSRSGDMFLWIHYQDPHGPYTPPAALRERSLDAERARPDGSRELPVDENQSGLGAIPAYQVIDGRRDVAFYRAGYAGEVRHLDNEVGRLLDGLALRGLYDDALIVFTADHGEGLGEDDYWFAHGEYLSEVLLHVPLLVRLPDGEPAVRDDAVGLHDLLPTLAARLNATPPPGLPGRDLFGDGASATSSPIYLATLAGSMTARVGLIQDGHRLVVSQQDGAWVPRLYRLGSEIPVDDAELTARLSDSLNALGASLSMRSATYQSALSEDDLADLRALGYLGGQQESSRGR
jgi:arylsulfatase A-like enzyme